MIATNLKVRDGRLEFAGFDTVALVKKYGTPLYLMDEERVRSNCRMYLQAMQDSFGIDSIPLYASKALSCKRIYEIVESEGLGIDVVSPGEIHTAVKAGFPMEKAFFHGNNKTDADIAFAMDNQVGYFVVDNVEELYAIEHIAERRGITQRCLLRVTPGIDPHTYDAVATGKVDSKFGIAIETGQAEEFYLYAAALPHLKVEGIHCHVGSMVFDEDVYERTALIMLEFLALLYHKHGFTGKYVNLGGGYGVRYRESAGVVDIPKRISALAEYMKEQSNRLEMPFPAVLLEPGRSIVADAGLTMYTVGSVKRIKGYKNYVSVDGGMTDNPRYALYKSQYTVFAPERMEAPPTLHCDVVGRCCESDDIIQPDVWLPELRRGDLLAVCTTGAYNYAMASHYNRIPNAPIVMLSAKGASVAVKRETLDQMIKNDV